MPKARVRSTMVKKIWYPIDARKSGFGYDVIVRRSARTCVQLFMLAHTRNIALLEPAFFWREVAWAEN